MLTLCVISVLTCGGCKLSLNIKSHKVLRRFLSAFCSLLKTTSIATWNQRWLSSWS